VSFFGFSESTLRFLGELSKNVDRAWFEAHEPEFQKSVIDPAKAFVETLGVRLRELDPKIQAIPRVRGSIKSMEQRSGFRKSPRPLYKDHLDIWFWSGKRRAWDNSGFYLRLTPTRLILAAGMIEFQKETLARYREEVANNERGAALETIVRDLRARGYVVGGESYKKTPRGVPANHPRATLLRHSGVFANLDREHPKELGTPELLDFVFAHYSRMAPLHRWLTALFP
jgi:uncharacterized protein (TIGR02453 family)